MALNSPVLAASFDKPFPDAVSQTSLTEMQAQQQCRHQRSLLRRSAESMSWLIILALHRLAGAEQQFDIPFKEEILLIVPVGASH